MNFWTGSCLPILLFLVTTVIYYRLESQYVYQHKCRVFVQTEELRSDSVLAARDGDLPGDRVASPHPRLAPPHPVSCATYYFLRHDPPIPADDSANIFCLEDEHSEVQCSQGLQNGQVVTCYMVPGQLFTYTLDLEAAKCQGAKLACDLYWGFFYLTLVVTLPYLIVGLFIGFRQWKEGKSPRRFKLKP